MAPVSTTCGASTCPDTGSLSALVQSSLIWLSHLQLLDSALPVGAFSHSFGLETLVESGEVAGSRDMEVFLETMLHGAWAPMDAMLVKGVYTLEGETLWKLDARMHAARPARETREGLAKMGRQMLRLCRFVHPELPWEPLDSAVRGGQCPGSWPLVYAYAARGLGIDLEMAAVGYLYSCCAAALGNAVRLSVLGQTASQTLLAALMPEMITAWTRVADRDPGDFSSCVPRVEIAQMEHERLPARLFMS